MKPACRPGLVPQVALKPRMGARSRGMVLNDLMSECPSLLNDLVFYPMWRGSQCVDMISGAVLTNSASPVLPTAQSPSGELAGVFASASSQYLEFPDIGGLRDFTVAVWHYPTAYSTAQALISQWNPSVSRRWEIWCSSIDGLFEFVVSHDNVYANAYKPKAVVAPSLNNWHMIAGTCVAGSRVGLAIDNLPEVNVSAPNSCYSVSVPINIGRYFSTGYVNGCLGPVAIWRRAVPTQELQLYWNNGMGIRYPF